MKTADYNQILYTVSRHNVLPLTSACNFDCAFCSHKQNPPGLEVFNLPHIAQEQYQEMIDFLDPHEKIVIGESSTRIIEGEPFCREDAVDIMEMVRRRHPKTPIVLTTNGSLIDNDDVGRLAALMPLEINLSLNYISGNTREALLGDTRNSGIVQTVEMLDNYSIPYNGSVVIVDFDGWEKELERAVTFLAGRGAGTMRIFCPGYTKYCRDNRCMVDYTQLSQIVGEIAGNSSIPVLLEPPVINDFKAVVEGVIRKTPALTAGLKKGDRIVRVNGAEVVSRVDAFNKVLRSGKPDIDIIRNGNKLRLRIDKEKGQPPGLVFKYDIDPGQMEGILRRIKGSKADSPVVVTGGTAYARIREYLCSNDSKIRVVKVENRFLGGNIACAGLLVVEDIIDALDRLTGGADLILIPSIAFDHRGLDLTGRSYREIEKTTGVETIIL